MSVFPKTGWYREHDDRLTSMWREGIKIGDMAERLGVSPSFVTTRRKELRLLPRQKDAPSEMHRLKIPGALAARMKPLCDTLGVNMNRYVADLIRRDMAARAKGGDADG